VAFAFYDFDHVEVFKLTEFVPVWDEETGALMAGIRYWQISADKPLHADIYTLEGVQSCIRKAGEALHPMDGNETPRPYKLVREKVPIEAEAIYTGINYPALPIVPCYGNDERQSEIVGTKENIDAYDLTKSGLINDISDMPLVYWVLENAGGMDEKDLAYWKAAINRNKVAKTDDEVHVTANTIGVPYQAQEVILTRLERDIYNDAMALNTRELAAGNVTATAIEAASEPLNNRADELEYCIGDCIEGLLALVGVADTPTFNRQKLTNQSEVAQMVLSAADYLDGDTVRKHLPFLTPDEADAVPDKLAAESMERITSPIPETDETSGTGNETEAIE
jgi:SPP1 family phage portal protein